MAIHLPFEKLSQWQKIAFSAVLIERMLPHYQMFSESVDFGDPKLLRNQLNLIWQRLDKSQKVNINYDAQLLKLEAQIPDPAAFDNFGVYPALDAIMSIMSLLQAMQENEGLGFDNVSRLSANSVQLYVEYCLAQASDDDAEIPLSAVKEHPLTQWEKSMQNELFDYLKVSPENVKTIKAIKKIALEEGLSNLGIEFES